MVIRFRTKWIEKMAQPIGLDESLHPVSLDRDITQNNQAEQESVYSLDRYYDFLWMIRIMIGREKTL